MSEQMRPIRQVAIIGAGAMGCLYASLLSGAAEVTLYDVIPSTVDAVNAHGVTLRERDGSTSCHRITAAMSGSAASPCDLVILFVKDTAGRAALAGNLSLIGPDTLVLSLQNGMGNLEVISAFVPASRILLGTTRHNAVAEAPGVIFHSGDGITHIGSPAGNREAVARVEALLASATVAIEPTEDVRYLLWEKLMLNLAINPVTALLDLPIGAMTADEDLRALARAMIAEAVAVAARDGAVFDADEVAASVFATAEHLRLGHASMWQDIANGRRTEIDFINGAVVRLGEKYGIPTPTNAAIVALIHARERREATDR